MSSPTIRCDASAPLNFGNVAVDATSPPQTVTVTSTGALPYRVFDFQSLANCDGQPFCYGGAFTCSTTCSTSTPYATNASCTVSASFSPIALGLQTTTIYLCDNTEATPSSRSTAPAWCPRRDHRAFNGTSQRAGGRESPTSRSRSRIRARSPRHRRPLDPGRSAWCHQLRRIVPPRGTCAAEGVRSDAVRFTSGDLVVPTFEPEGDPLASRAKSAADPVPSATAPLAGTGVHSAVLTMPSSVNVGAYTPGSAPITQVVTLTNTGNAVFTFSTITVSEPFTVVNNCPLNLAPGVSCTLTVGFSATVIGAHNGTLTVMNDAPGGSRAIALSALVQLQPDPVIRVAPTVIGFGNRMFGTQSAAQRITITNDGGSEAALAGMAVGVDFLILNTSCG